MPDDVVSEFAIQPLYLIPDKHVEIKEDLNLEAPAAVQELRKRKRYLIKINRPLALELYARSVLYNKIPFDFMMTGFMYHEVAHIKYFSFDYSVSDDIDNDLFRTITNILLDSQIEYQLAKDVPEAARYIRYILVAIRRYLDLSQVKQTKAGLKIFELMNELFYLTRFGVVLPNSDQEFMNFVVPLILSSMRNSKVKNVYESAIAIYEYLFATIDPNDLKTIRLLQKASSSLVAISEDDLEKLEGGDSVLSSNLIDTANQILNDQDGMIAKKAGHGNFKVEIEEIDDPYYRTTVQKHRNKILVVRNAFKRKVNEVITREAYEGDFSVWQQQQAYIDSFSGEEGEYYTVPLLESRTIDNLIVRDISSSTSDDKDKYAESCIILHAAIQEIPGIRDAHIDFSDSAATLLEFDANLRTARIHPRAEGGTYISSALEFALKMKWRGRKRLINIITDGEISDSYEYLEKQLQSLGIKITYWHVGSPYASRMKNLRVTSIEKFPYEIAQMILKEL